MMFKKSGVAVAIMPGLSHPSREAIQFSSTLRLSHSRLLAQDEHRTTLLSCPWRCSLRLSCEDGASTTADGGPFHWSD
jgi:anaerobic selenocysteine-containing dehydrogenase